jgi:pseudaminic acid synthase
MMRIEEREISLESPPFVIAEMSGNHNRSLERALAIVDAAGAAGAHGLKIQTYTADTLTLDVDRDEFVVRDPDSPWAGRSLHDLYSEAHTPWEWHEEIFRRARRHQMIPFSTPFDETAVDFLEELDSPCYKIASFEITHLPLIRKVARTGKPIIMSTGMATIEEIEEAVEAARSEGAADLALLKCTSAYPADPADSNLRTIPDLRERFGCEAGLSDHTLGLAVPLAAVALQATVIEKHFTVSRADGGVDSTFSLEPDEMMALVSASETAWRSLGRVSYGPTEHEKASLKFRRSLYVSRDVSAGEPFTSENVKVVRPGLGLAPKHYEDVLGKKAACDLSKGTPLSWDLVE